MQATTAHFIHCIKPNDKEQPELLSYDMVAGQLIQLGTLDVVRLMGLGFPVRLKYGDILERYLPPLQVRPSSIHDRMQSKIATSPRNVRAWRRG
jgi:myosin heavy subunit